MLNIKTRNKNIISWYTDNLSRDDLVGNLLALLTSGGGIWLVIKIINL